MVPYYTIYTYPPVVITQLALHVRHCEPAGAAISSPGGDCIPARMFKSDQLFWYWNIICYPIIIRLINLLFNISKYHTFFKIAILS